jgi:hypothetical protein
METTRALSESEREEKFIQNFGWKSERNLQLKYLGVSTR